MPVSSVSPVPPSALDRLPSPPEITFLGYVGEDGGDAVQVFELARSLARRGTKATLVVPDLPGLREKAARYAAPGLHVVCTSLIRYDTPAQNPADVFRLLWPLRNVPLLHVYCGDICPPRLSLLVLSLLRPPAVFATIQAAKPDMAFGGKRAAYWAACAGRDWFKTVICPSRQGQETQIKYGVPTQKAHVIYNGVDTKHYARGNAAAARESLGLAADVPLLLFMSRMHRQKCPLDALNAFALAAENLPDVHFAMVGNGPMEAEAKARAAHLPCANRIHFANYAQNVPDFLAACDVWILPSEAENFSLAVIESLAAGCAVVATDCAGNNEVLVDEENALVASVGDVPALANAITRLFNDPSLRARLQAAAPKTAARFTLEALTDAHQAVYAPFVPAARQGVTR